MKRVAAVALIVMPLTGCNPIPQKAEPDQGPTTVTPGRYELKDNLGDGGLYRFDTATGTLCYMQNLTNPKTLLSPRQWNEMLAKAEAEGRKFSAAIALAEDCTG